MSGAPSDSPLPPKRRGRIILARVTLGFGVFVILATLLGWYLLSGFGCEMNTSGCGRVRLDMSRDSLSIFLPALAVGALLVALGLRGSFKRR